MLPLPALNSFKKQQKCAVKTVTLFKKILFTFSFKYCMFIILIHLTYSFTFT